MQVPRHRGARLRSEQPERRPLGRDEHDVEVESCAAAVVGGEQREVVQRQRPAGAGRRRERERVAATRVERLDRLPDRQDVARAGEGQRARDHVARARPEREQQRVVAERRPVARVDLPRVRVHADHRVGDPAHAAVARDRLPLVPARRTGAERLGDRQRGIGEVAARRDDVDPDPVAGERLEREQPLQGADAAAGDERVLCHAASLGRTGPPRIRSEVQTRCGFPADASDRSRAFYGADLRPRSDAGPPRRRHACSSAEPTEGAAMTGLARKGGIAASIILIAFGIAAVVVGFAGRETVRDELAREQIVGTPDSAIPGEKVDTGSEAREFAAVMRRHTLEATGGQTYAQMGRFLDESGEPTSDEAAAATDPQTGEPVENPARNIWISSTAFQTALNTAYFAENVATFVIAMGGALLLVGIGFLVLTLRLLKREPAAARRASMPTAAGVQA
jgi:hypothetical protein